MLVQFQFDLIAMVALNLDGGILYGATGAA
jgi:hypothetical protein